MLRGDNRFVPGYATENNAHMHKVFIEEKLEKQAVHNQLVFII